MLNEIENFDFLRGSLMCYILFIATIMIYSPQNVKCKEFAVRRMSQCDVHKVTYGCRQSQLSLEAKSINSWESRRHCVIAKMENLSIMEYNKIRQYAGALILLLPRNISQMSNAERQYFNLLEHTMMTKTAYIPIYFSVYNIELDNIILDIANSNFDGRLSSENQISLPVLHLRNLLTFYTGNHYQISVTGIDNTSTNNKIPIIQGELPHPGHQDFDHALKRNNHNQVPMIIFTANLKTFGLYYECPMSVDAAMLITLANLFSKLYNSSNFTPKYRLLFVLSESGQLLNFNSIKAWLDSNNQIKNVHFVVCLDTIVQALNTQAKELHFHVSKLPKNKSPLDVFLKHLQATALAYNVSAEIIHKKINLSDQNLAWEHERFSIKRMPAFTLSALRTPQHTMRKTVFQMDETAITTATQLNIKIVVEALAKYIFGAKLCDHNDIVQLFSGTMEIDAAVVKGYLNLKSTFVNNGIQHIFQNYLYNVKLFYDNPDLSNSIFILYEDRNAYLNIYRIKPALFDLLLTIIISIYLYIFFIAIELLPVLYTLISEKHISNDGNYKNLKTK